MSIWCDPGQEYLIPFAKEKARQLRELVMLVDADIPALHRRFDLDGSTTVTINVQRISEDDWVDQIRITGGKSAIGYFRGSTMGACIPENWLSNSSSVFNGLFNSRVFLAGSTVSSPKFGTWANLDFSAESRLSIINVLRSLGEDRLLERYLRWNAFFDPDPTDPLNNPTNRSDIWYLAENFKLDFGSGLTGFRATVIYQKSILDPVTGLDVIYDMTLVIPSRSDNVSVSSFVLKEVKLIDLVSAKDSDIIQTYGTVDVSGQLPVVTDGYGAITARPLSGLYISGFDAAGTGYQVKWSGGTDPATFSWQIVHAITPLDIPGQHDEFRNFMDGTTYNFGYGVSGTEDTGAPVALFESSQYPEMSISDLHIYDSGHGAGDPVHWNYVTRSLRTGVTIKGQTQHKVDAFGITGIPWNYFYITSSSIFVYKNGGLKKTISGVYSTYIPSYVYQIGGLSGFRSLADIAAAGALGARGGHVIYTDEFGSPYTFGEWIADSGNLQNFFLLDDINPPSQRYGTNGKFIGPKSTEDLWDMVTVVYVPGTGSGIAWMKPGFTTAQADYFFYLSEPSLTDPTAEAARVATLTASLVTLRALYEIIDNDIGLSLSYFDAACAGDTMVLVLA